MAMTDEELMRLSFFVRQPIPRIPYWDPVPPWVKLTAAQLGKFNDLQISLNAKIAEIEAQKIRELGKIAGISLR